MEIHPRSMKFQKIYAKVISPTFGRRQNSIRKKKAQRQVFPEGIPTSMTSVENPCQIHGNPIKIHEFHGKSTPDPSHIHGNPLVATSGKVSLLIDVDTMDTTRPLEVHEIHKEKKAQDLTRQPAERSADSQNMTSCYSCTKTCDRVLFFLTAFSSVLAAANQNRLTNV